MSIIEIIKKRKSVRSFSSEELSIDTLNKLKIYISELVAPFGVQARVELVSSESDEKPVKLGTYGVISGAKHYLVLLVKDGQLSDMGAGYIFEQAILHCTELGLGTCWLGATFSQSNFEKQVILEEAETLNMISPVGHAREQKRLLERIMRVGAGSDNRKSFDSLFFNQNFAATLTEEDASDYITPLEMVRLAPSASNKQPWRVVKDENYLHFYHKPNRFSLNDIGIALCHFELACNELNLKGKFATMDYTPSSKGIEYLISWIGES